MQLIQVKPVANPKFILTSEHVFWTAFILIFISFIFYFIFDLSESLLFVICISTFSLPLLVTPIWSRFEYYTDQYEIQGPINLTYTDISFESKSYSLREIENLSFYVNDYKGKRRNISYRCGPSLSQGINNYIRFKYHGELHEIQIQFNSESKISSLGTYLTELYKQGFDFDEYIGDTKAYGLTMPRSYAETQEFKKIWPRKFAKKN
ncbi:MAG: hypothetical protein WBB36_16025 [Chitinophagales bacterium]